jgi:hypothetical protein
MKFWVNIYKSDIQDKKSVSSFTDLVEDEDYYFNEKDGYYKFSVDLGELVRGDIIEDLYENILTIELDKTTIYTFQTLNLNNDDSLLRLLPKISLQLNTLIDFSNKLINYYQKTIDNNGFYSLKHENIDATSHRFTANNESYKIDSYNTIDNETDEIELYNYDQKTTQKISVKGKNEITILEHNFTIRKLLFKDKKIEILSKLLSLIEVSKYYKGPNSFLEFENSY